MRTLRSPAGALLLLGSTLCGSALSGADAWAQDSSGLLKITSPVAGAQVYVDNQLVGETPLTTYAAPGDHTVRVSADGHDPYVRRVTIVADRTTELTASLLPGKGTVEFAVEPMGANLVVNGRDEYRTPVRLRDLAPGNYTWELSADGFETESGEFTFTSGKNLFIVETLESSAGRFAISSRPDGANVFVDGNLVGATPLALENVEAGVHQVLLELKGHAAVIRTVDTSDGSKGVVDVRMPEDGAALTVKTNSPDAIVRLNGVRVGEGRKVRVPELERGRYALSVAEPGGPAVEARVEVPDSGGAWWSAKVGEDGKLREYTPLTRSWIFWAGAGAVAGGAAAGGVIAYNATIPDPTPEGDIVVSLP